MRFRNYLEDLLGTKVKIKVLRELHKFPTKAYTIRELANSIKDITHSGVRKAIIELRKSNVILIEHHGQSSNIILNKKSIVYDAFKTIFDKESNEFESFRNLLAAGAPGEISSISIFGSIAKLMELPESDIDLLIISNNKEAAMEFIEIKAPEVMNKYGNVIVPFVMSREEFKDRKRSQFAKELLNKHIKVMGEDIRDLIQ